MSRPLFFTGRKQIALSDISIRLIEIPDRPTKFEANVDLTSYDLAPDSTVVIEAYHKTYLERFDLGTVALFTNPQKRELSGLEPNGQPLFRIKVITSDGVIAGRQLAAADRIRPQKDDDGSDPRSILPIIPVTRDQIGDEFWQVRFEEGGEEKSPVLWVNRDVPNLYASFQSLEIKVTAMVLPEVVRQVLRGLVEDDVPWTDEGVLGKWLNDFAIKLWPDQYEDWDGDDPEGSRQKRRDWVDQVVASFAKQHRLFDLYCDQRNELEAEGANNA